MNATEMLVAVLVPLGGMAMIFGIVYLVKRENLAMIEKGMNPKIDRPVPYKNLKWGLLLVGAGLGLFFAYMLDRYVMKDFDNPAIYFALIAIGGGLGLIGSYRVEKKELLDRNNGQ
ncbi:MAG TPA: DUF6249 domain-containing protein [Puia sp.]|nr:DUF6249 domain-containing protein [Puia sp.]